MPYFYIYKMRNPSTGQFYIGRRVSSSRPEEDTNYRGSSKTWYRNLSKDEISLLEKEILETDFEDFESLCIRENLLIETHIKNPLCMNAHIPSIGFYCKGHTDETSKTISEKLKSNSNGSGNKGKTLSEDHKNKISNSLTGRSHTEERKENISNSLKGLMTEVQLGKKRGPYKKSNKPKKPRGPMSEQHKLAISNAKKKNRLKQKTD